MKKIFLFIIMLFIFCISVFANDDCTYLAKIAATALEDEPFVVKVVFCEMIMNRVKSEKFPDTLPAISYSLGIRKKLRTPTEDDMRAAALALNGTDFGRGALYFEKCNKIKRTPPEKRGGVRLYDWYFYSAISI